MSDLVLSERWWGLGDLSPQVERARESVERELGLEIAPEHELFGLIASVEAFFGASDDVVVRLADGTYALVHPTWTGRPDRPPWPRTDVLGHGEKATEAVAEWESHR